MAELEKKTDKAEDLKKALSLFTFQGQMERYKPQRGSRLPLVPMLASLREMSPRQWAAYAFGRDPLRGKFTPEQMQELSDKALACGQEEASKLLDTHHGKVEPTLLLATDPDCDRLGVAVREKDGSFRLLTGNQIGCLMLYYILSCKKAQGKLPANGAVVKSIVSTELARAICKDFGVALFDTLTGFKFIGEKIQQFQDTGSHTFLFGFEESYGYLSSTFVRDKDGVNASLLIAEAACYYSTQGKTLCDVMAEIFQRYGYYLEHVESTTLPGIDGLKVMAEIMARIRKNPPVEIGGVKVARVLDIMAGTETDVATCKVTKLDYPESDVLYFAMEGGHFVCVRPSGTEPKIKLYVNVNDPDQAKAQELLEHLTAEAQKLLK